MSTTVSAPQIHSRVQEFIAKPRKMLIDGKWVEAASGKTFPTYSPATGEVMAQIMPAEALRDLRVTLFGRLPGSRRSPG